MTSKLLRRAASVIPLLIGVSFVVFVMVNLTPGDPARYLAGANSTPEQVEEVREALNLDRPLAQQYGSWLTSAAQGDLGQSLVYKQDVTNLVVPRAAVTASLALFAFGFAIVLALILSLVAASRPGGKIDQAVSGISAVSLAIPPFWLGMMLILLFAVQRSLFPTLGYAGLDEGLSEWAYHLILPGIALGLTPMAELTLQLRASLVDVLGKDYILSAHAKGISRRAILLKHALKNASVPVVTVLGTRIGQLVGGAVTVETVFSLPGLGRLAVEATTGRDLPVLLGIVILTTAAVAIFNLLADLSNLYLNPKLARS